VAGATRPVQGGAYSGPRSEPGGQNTPRAGRVVASYGTYTVAAGTFAQQVDQGDIWDDAATAIVTAGGSGVESYVYVPPYTDSGTGTVTASGTGFQTYTPYDAVLDEDNPVSHWKLGDASTAIDRRGVRNHPAINGPIDTAAGLVANNASDQSNVFTGVANVSFNAGTGTGFGLPYEGAYTMEAWVKPTADFDGLVVKRTVATYLALLNTNSGSGSAVQVGFSVENSANVSFNLTSPFADLLPLNQTFHIVGTYDGTTAILYINGVEAKRTTSVGVGGIRSSTTTPPFIGAARVTSWPRAGVDEVAWYNGALTPARILAHYQAGVATAYDAVIDADTPVSHWKMGWSTTKAVDRARRQLNLDAQNPPIAISDKGVVYQGDNDRANTFVTGSSQRFSNLDSAAVDADGTLYNTANLSVEAWIKPSATSVGGSYGILRRPTSEISLSLLSAKPLFELLAPGNSTKTVISPTSVTAYANYHLVGTYDGLNLILYVNGTEVGRLANATGIKSELTTYPQIGYIGGQYWDGDIDEVAWYDTVLSPARVRAHFLAGLAGYITPNGTGTDSATHSSSGSGTIIASGTGTESNVVLSAYAAAVLADSPNGYWRLNDLSDSSGHGFTLTPAGSPASTASLLPADPANGAYVFNNDTTQTLSVADDPALRLSVGFTAEAWFRVDYVPASFWLFQKNQHYALGIQSVGGLSKMQFTIWTAVGNFWQASGATTLAAGVVYHAVLTWDGATARVYLNGVEDLSLAATGTPHTDATHFCIGKDLDSGAFGWFGGVDEVAVYPSLLSPARILSRYQAGTGGVTYTDSGSGTVTGSGTGVEGYAYADSGVGVVTASGTGTESAAHSASGTCTATASGTALESASATDSATGTLTASGAGTESATRSGTGPGTVTASGTAVEAYTSSDSATATATTSGTGAESAARSASGTCTATASGTGVEAFASSDSGTGTSTASGTGVEAYAASDSATATVTASGSGVESYTVTSTYTDTGSGTISTTGSGAESHSYDYSASGTVSTSGSGAESGSYTDSASATTNATGSGVDSHSYDFSATGTVATSGTGADSYSCTDSAAGTSVILGSGTESYVVGASSALLIATVI
jgi:hypothetical protein